MSAMHDTTAEQRDQSAEGRKAGIASDQITQDLKSLAVAPKPTSSASAVPYTPPPHPSAGSGSGYAASDVEQLWDQLRTKDAQILMLQKRLSHFRTWVSTIHQRISSVNPHAIKNSRRLYIGGVPPETQDDELRHFFNSLMIQSGALISPGSAILSCKITSEKSYAFVEFRSVEEASNAMAFDGVAFKDVYLKIRRPSNYDHNTAIMLGPTYPDPTMDTSGLDICRTVVEDSPHKLFIGGLPCDWSEDSVKELLAPYGNLKSFNLVMDKVTGKSKGYAFCEYADETVSDYAIRNLNGRKLGQKMLTVKRALEGGRVGGRGPMSPAGPHGGSGGGMRMQQYGGGAPPNMQAINTQGPPPGYGQYQGGYPQQQGGYSNPAAGSITPTAHTASDSPYAPQGAAAGGSATSGGATGSQGGSGPSGSQPEARPFGVPPPPMSGMNNLW